MKAIIFVLLVIISYSADLVASPCEDALNKVGEQIPEDAQKSLLYFAHLNKSYLDEATVQKILNAQEVIKIEDLRFKSNVSVSAQISLKKGVVAALAKPAVRENWKLIQQRLRDLYSAENGEKQKVEDIKSSTKAIWHESNPFLIRDNGIDQKNDYGPAVSNLKDGSLILYGSRPNKEAFFFSTKDKKHYSFHELDKFYSTLIEDPPGFDEPYIFVGIKQGEVKVVNSKGKLIRKFLLVDKLPKEHRESLLNEVYSYSPSSIVLREKNEIRVLFQYAESPNTRSQKVVIFDLNENKIKVLESPEYHFKPFLSTTGRVLAKATHFSPEVYDLELKKHIGKIPFHLTTNAMVHEAGAKFLTSNPSFQNKDKLYFINLVTLKEELLEFKLAPFMSTSKADYLGSFNNKLNEEIHFLFFESVDTRHNSLAAFNSNTKEVSEWIVESSDVPSRLQHPQIKQLSDGNFVLTYIRPAMATSSGGVYLLSLLSGDKIKVSKLGNIDRIMGINSINDSISIFYEDVEAGRPNEVREIEVFGTKY